jgi:hypothetical protein
MQSKINSVINLGLASSAPDSIKNTEIRAAIELITLTANNLLQAIEDYLQPTTKDITQWSSVQPSTTLLRHQLGRIYPIAFENLTFGQFVNLFKSGGVLQARRAQATAGTVRKAHGYMNAPAAGILAGNRCEIIIAQGFLSITGVDSGDDLFLSAGTPGTVTLAPPNAVGQLEQFIGFGVALNKAYIDISLGQFIQH